MKRLLLLVALLLVACGGWPGLDHGTIIGREYDDPDEWFTTGVCIPSGNTAICIPGQTHYDGPHWYLNLSDGDKKGWVEVDLTTFNNARDGATYP